MSEWRETTLAEVATTVGGKYVPAESYVGTGQFVIYGSNSVMGRYSRANVHTPHLVVAGVGANAGVSRFVSGPSWINNNAFGLVPSTLDVTAAFLACWYEARVDLTKILAGTGQPYVKKPLLMSYPITLPPLTEQRRIVAVMSAVDAQIEALAAEGQSLAVLLHRLRAETFSLLCGRGQVGAEAMFDLLLGRQKSERQSVGDHVIPYVRAGNIGDNALKLGDVLTMNFDLREQEKYGLRMDDVVLSEGGTIGNAARWSEQVPGVVGFDKHVIRLRARPGRSVSEYALHWAHWSRESGSFDATATGITIKALGFGRASAMPVPDLDVDEQVRLTAPLEALSDAISRRTAELSALHAFRSGLLTALLSQEITVDAAVDQFMKAA